MTVHSADLAAYIDAICETMRCERIHENVCHCTIPVLAQWKAIGESAQRCRANLEAQIITWIAGQLVRGEVLPPFGGIQPEITDVVTPEILTEHLRLVPYTATYKAAAQCDLVALAVTLGVRVHPDWPYPAVTFDEASGTTSENQPAAEVPTDIPEFDMLDGLRIFPALSDPTSAPWEWMIVHRSDNVLIGEIGTSNPPKDEPGEDSIQFKYSLVPEYQRRGYMTEAARAYVAWAFSHPALTWIYATTERENLASQRVLEKIGARPFTREDSIREWIDWEILPEYVRSAVP